MKKVKVKPYVAELIRIANNVKTLYVMGCLGAPMTKPMKEYHINHHSYNQRPHRKQMILNATPDTYGFDCVCLLKSVWWGWDGSNTLFGGAKYNAKEDVNADAMFAKCSNKSTDFSNIPYGSALYCKGHIGIYIGNGLAVECTPGWKNCVQITAVKQTIPGYPTRWNWTHHGLLHFVDYSDAAKPTKPTKPTKPAKPAKPTDGNTIDRLAAEVIQGKWGNGAERKRRLKAAGHDARTVQLEVDYRLNPKRQQIDKIAREVIAGKWGNNPTRRIKLRAAGHNAALVQHRVNRIVKG